MQSHRKWVILKLTVISSFIDPNHILYCAYFYLFIDYIYWSYSYLLLYIFLPFLLTTFIDPIHIFYSTYFYLFIDYI